MQDQIPMIVSLKKQKLIEASEKSESVQLLQDEILNLTRLILVEANCSGNE